MPLTEVTFANGETLRLDDALAQAATRLDERQITYEVLNAILLERQERGNRISTTTLTAKCLRSEVLKRTQPYAESVERMWPSFRGTMIHRVLEHSAHPDAVAEARYWTNVDGEPLSGSPDLVAPVQGFLYDYKTCKEVPRYGPWPDHIEQVQINRWLVDHATHVEVGGKKVRITKANRHQYVPYEWQGLVLVYLDDKGPKPYLVTRSEEVPAKTTGGTKRVRVTDIWDDERVEALVHERYPAAYDALNGGELPPIPEGWEHQSHVLCSFCPLRAMCAQLESEGR